MLALALLGCDSHDDAPGPAQRLAEPRPADGMRYVGWGRAVVEVPEDWPVVNQICAPQKGDEVVYLSDASMYARCMPLLRRPYGLTVGVGSVSSRSGSSVLEALGVADVGGVRTGELTCQVETRTEGEVESKLRVCTQTFAAEDAYFTVTAYSVTATRIDEVRESLTVLPEAWTTVPMLVYGVSTKDALKAMEDAGLQTEAPEATGQYYITGTDPLMGSVVRVGSHITLTVGED